MKYFWLVEGSVFALKIVFLFVGLIILNWLLKKSLKSALDKTPAGSWKEHLGYVILSPAKTILWIFLIASVFKITMDKLALDQSSIYVMPLRNIGIILCLVWSFFRWKKVFYSTLSQRFSKGSLSIDPISFEMFSKIATIVVFFVSSLVILQILGFDIIPVMTVGGIGVAAIGFASKDLIANAFGGLMLYATRPFHIGDFVEIPEKNLSGHIENIGWYLTTMRDLQRRPVYIPNAFFSSGILSNLSRMTHRCIHETFPVHFSDVRKIPSLLVKINKVLSVHQDIDHRQPLHVFFKASDPIFFVAREPFRVGVEIKAYTSSTTYEDFMKIKEAILFKIHELFQEDGVEILYPTSRVENICKDNKKLYESP